MTEFAIKVRKHGDKRWSFLSSKGGMNHLRIHAARFPDKASAVSVINDNEANNPQHDWQVVEL